MTYLRRLFACLLQLIITLDEFLQVLVRAPWYVATGRHKPSGHMTVSAWVGVYAAKGSPWAVEAAALLDSVLGRRHCEQAALLEATFES